jgi:N-acetylglutamate synthase-like GNAT family acetyltransferase
LPPLFIEEFVPGFLVVEHEGELIGCGGNEIYGDSAVIRSVVVHERARGSGLGGEIARLLTDDARSFGARDLYLFTLDAHDFWLRAGFRDVSLDAWKDEAREQWQYQFCSRFPEAVHGVYSMWSPA